jgi:hypothetical protein
MSSTSHSNNLMTEAKLQAIVHDWNNDQNSLRRLGYRLKHQYTPQSFSYSSLKGRDSVLLETLMAAKASTGELLFQTHLLLMQRNVMEAEGQFEDEYDCDSDLFGWMYACKVLDETGSRIGSKGWSMFLLSTGWMVDEIDFERLDNTSSDEDDPEDFPPMNSKTIMFPDEFAKEHIELNWGNAASTRELWFYAAAIVIAPAQESRSSEGVEQRPRTRPRGRQKPATRWNYISSWKIREE